MEVTQDGFQEKFNQTFFNSYGFAIHMFMVTKETAKNITWKQYLI